jgi:hypothetical protein
LFWSIYTIEKMLALRLGRSSTIRENDISVPKIGHENSPHAIFNQISPIWIATSDLQGRVYDELYSPGSLAQPDDVRTSTARALAEEAKRLLHAQDDIQVRARQPDDTSILLSFQIPRRVQEEGCNTNFLSPREKTWAKHSVSWTQACMSCFGVQNGWPHYPC